MAVERLKTCDNIVALSKELGVHRRLLYKWRDQFAPFDENAEPRDREFAAGHAPPKSASAQARAGGQDSGVGFFQRCLAKSRGSTPAERKLWREGIYDQIREVMSLQGSLSIERMCQLAQVSRAGFYRSLQGSEPVRKRWRCGPRFRRSRWSIDVAMAIDGSPRNCADAGCK